MLFDSAPGPIPSLDGYTRDPLLGELETEVCIIGGGITGIATAFALSKRRIQCVVLEASRVGAGGTGASSGQLLVGTIPDCDELDRKYGCGIRTFLWDLSVEGLANAKALAQTAGAPCQYKPGNLVVAETETQSKALQARTNYRANELNYRSEYMVSGVELREHVNSPKYRLGAFDLNGAHLDSAALVSNLARAAERQGAVVFEGSAVLSVDQKEGRVYLENASVKARHIILSAGPWAGTLDANLSRYISSVYVYTGCFESRTSLASELLPKGSAVSDLRNLTTFFKPLPSGGLYLGGPCSVYPLSEASARNQLTGLMADIFPHATDWSCFDVKRGVLCVSCDQLPFCDRRGDRIFWVGGYSGQGLTWSVTMAELIADTLTGESARFDQLAALRRRAIEPLAPIRPLFTPLALAYYRFLDGHHMRRLDF